MAQSWKALASKINNQAPLGARESDRLLTALTSSFRKHLDEVHPGLSHEEARRSSVNSGTGNSNRHGIHSSIALADSHMASLLTNPLLVKSAKPAALPKAKLDAVSAATELENGAKPFDLLESYHAKGFATIEVALSCMQHFRRSIKDLAHEAQVAKVQEEEAGKRVLSWLWTSETLQSQAYVDNVHMQDGLVWLVMMEGHEDFLWQWLESDLELPQPSAFKLTNKSHPGYAWKSRVIYAMVMTKLRSPHREARSADAALELYFRAIQRFQYKKGAGVHEQMVSTSRARSALEKALTYGSGVHYSNTSPHLYDKFTQTYAIHDYNLSHYTQNNALEDIHRAQLDLWHPTRPSANIWYALVTREMLANNEIDLVRTLLQTSKTKAETKDYIKAFARAARLMKIAGKEEEYARLVTLARNFYPDNGSDISRLLGEVSDKGRLTTQTDKKSEKQQHDQQNQQNWLSNYFPVPT